MPKILYFNPETDLVLATNGLNYTPPKKIKELRCKLALLPSLLAEEGDCILVDNPVNSQYDPYYEIVRNKNLKILSPSDLSTLQYKEFDEVSDPDKFEISPWGWNNWLVKELSTWGVPAYTLPNDKWLLNFKNLSHRKSTILFFNKFKNKINIPPPELHFLPESATVSVNKFGQACIKAPWSSSGRGILFSNQIDNETKENRINSIINSQGSVIIEKYWDKKIDCATEWIITKDNINFIGHSIFKTDSHGQYINNTIDTEDNLVKIIRSNISHIAYDYLSLQKEFITEFIKPYYIGPLGIDMLIDKSGILNPFVELNLRTTMGYAAIRIQNYLENKHNKEIWRHSTFLKQTKNNMTWRPI